MPVAEIVVDEEFEGPSLPELASSMGEISEDPVRVWWDNTRDEILAFRSFPDRRFALYVKDIQVKDRTIAALGLPLDVPQAMLTQARVALVDKQTYDWRNFNAGKSEISVRNILLKLVADSLRKGGRPILAEILPSLYFDNIPALDMDVLLRLRAAMKGKP